MNAHFFGLSLINKYMNKIANRRNKLKSQTWTKRMKQETAESQIASRKRS